MTLRELCSACKKAEKVITLKEAEYLALLAEVKKGQESQDKMLRHQADLENVRKRIDREKQEFIKFANEGLILDLLNVLDDLERTVDLAEAGKEELSAFVKGIEMKIKYFSDTDTAMVEFSDHNVAETRDINENIYIDLDVSGNLVAMTIEHARQQASLPYVSYEQVEVK